MSAPDRIWAVPEVGTCADVAEERAPDGATEYLARDGETVTALVEALARLCNELEMPGERGVLHGIPAALSAARAVLAKLEGR